MTRETHIGAQNVIRRLGVTALTGADHFIVIDKYRVRVCWIKPRTGRAHRWIMTGHAIIGALDVTNALVTEVTIGTNAQHISMINKQHRSPGRYLSTYRFVMTAFALSGRGYMTADFCMTGFTAHKDLQVIHLIHRPPIKTDMMTGVALRTGR